MNGMLSSVMEVFTRARSSPPGPGAAPVATRIPRIEEIAADPMAGSLARIEAIRGPVLATACWATLQKKWFDICALDAMLQAAGVIPDGDTHRLLRTLHCVDWSDMPPEVRAWAQQTIVRMVATGIDA